MRRTHLRGHEKIHKRQLIHVAAFNLGLLMRAIFGLGTPRALQDAGKAMGGVVLSLLQAAWAVCVAIERRWLRLWAILAVGRRDPSHPPRICSA